MKLCFRGRPKLCQQGRKAPQSRKDAHHTRNCSASDTCCPRRMTWASLEPVLPGALYAQLNEQSHTHPQIEPECRVASTTPPVVSGAHGGLNELTEEVRGM
ncbi:hypothetical protein MHYP_G00212690 [Metynnis hypsauchen]